MIRVFLAFVLLTVVFGFGISWFRTLSGKEVWGLTKSVTYAIMCSILSLMVLVGLVILF
jgi:hypothetical protein